VNQCMDEWIRAVSPCAAADCNLPAVDIGLVCSGIYAQKNKTILNSRGYKVEYPYLSHEIVDLALQRARFWPGVKQQEKHALKLLLASRVPPELVYRRKSGFMADTRHKFAAPRFLSHLEAAMDGQSHLRNVLERKILGKLFGAVRDKTPLPNHVYKFLWAVTFVNRWLSQI